MNLIDDLQRIEAGLINYITPELQNAITSVIIRHGAPLNPICTLCQTDIIIIHHIKSYKGHRAYGHDESLYDGDIGIIYICPNCHYRIHQLNPYFIKQRPITWHQINLLWNKG